jgi:AGCS family alanine or glycine:cation symporter
VTHPVKQGLVQSLGVYFDTWLICSITAFIILVSVPDVNGAERGISLTQGALADSLGAWANIVLVIVVFLLAFSSILGNYYYGESNIEFITTSRRVLTGYRIFAVLAVGAGALLSVDVVWNFADGVMGLMALTNLIAIGLLSGIAFRLLKDYTQQRREGLDPVFTRDRLPDVDGIEVWEDALSVTGPIDLPTRKRQAEKHRDHLHGAPHQD